MTASDDRDHQDPPALAGSVGPRLSRRRFLGSLGVSAGALALSSALSACDPSTPTPQRSAAVDWVEWWSEQEQKGILDFANWPYYIDRTRENTHPSLLRFTQETGIGVNYYRPINDDARFLDEIRPALEAGKPIGYDIIVITNGPQLSELIERDWLTPLDHVRLVQFGKYASPLVTDPPWDPGNRYTVAWQSGLTGIGYRPEAVKALGRPPSTVRDLWDPALAGRVGMFEDLMDLGSFGLLAQGIDPQTSSELDWRLAATLLRQQQLDGLVRRYYDQSYLTALQRGDTWISQAWSGDIFQAKLLGHPELEFVVPDEGAMLWTDNMVIPRGAAHPVDAMTYVDFVYRPDIAAMIADWVGFMSPVPLAQSIILHRYGDQELAESPLAFPGPDLVGERRTVSFIDVYGRVRHTSVFRHSPFKNYYVFADNLERQAWQRTFEPLVAP